MKKSKYNGCCAVQYIWELDSIDTWGEIDKERAKKELIRVIKKIENDNWRRTTLIIAILSESQYQDLGRIFRKHGFKVKQEFDGNDEPVLYLMTRICDETFDESEGAEDML